MARLKPAFAAATSIVWVFFQGHEKPLLAIVDVATGHPCALLRLGKAQVLPDRPPTPGGPGRNLRKAVA